MLSLPHRHTKMDNPTLIGSYRSPLDTHWKRVKEFLLHDSIGPSRQSRPLRPEKTRSVAVGGNPASRKCLRASRHWVSSEDPKAWSSSWRGWTSKTGHSWRGQRTMPDGTQGESPHKAQRSHMGAPVTQDFDRSSCRCRGAVCLLTSQGR